MTIIFLLRVSGVEIRAEGSPTISVSEITAKPGEEVVLEVNMADNPGICTMRLGINYDENLTLIAVKDENLLKESMFGGDKSANPYYVMWDESLKSSNNKGNGTLVTLTFKLNEKAAPGMYKVWITYGKGDIYNRSLQDIDFKLVDGKVTVPEGKKTTETGDGSDDKGDSRENGEDSDNTGTEQTDNGDKAAGNNLTDTNNSDTIVDQDDKTGSGSEGTDKSPESTEIKNFTIITTGDTGKKITAKYTVEKAAKGTKTKGKVKLASLKTEEPDVVIPDTITYEGKTITS